MHRCSGAPWLDRIVDGARRWHIPYYPDGPVTNFDDIVRLWTWLDRGTRRLFADWPVPALFVNSTESPVGEIV